jgi:peptidoglycan/xylan/chitin deacetylase (PgdA/CDA1 family)
MIARFVGQTGIGYCLRKVAPWSGLLCLNYHRVGDGSASLFDRDLWSATSDDFEAQVKFLKANFDVIRLDALPEVLARGKGRHVLITFDDGYQDNYEFAFPILRAHGLSATFFLSTGFLDRPRLSWWDEIAWMVRSSSRDSVNGAPWFSSPVTFDEPHRKVAIRTLLRVYKTIPTESTDAYLDFLGTATGSGRWTSADSSGIWMSWDMVREMRAAGMCIGGHTVNHPILARMPREQQWKEIDECGQRLAEELGEPMRSFSYPVGNTSTFNADTRLCLSRAGVRFAFSYYGGFRQFDQWDDYDIRRIAVESYMSRDLFCATVSFPQLFARPIAARRRVLTESSVESIAGV